MVTIYLLILCHWILKLGLKMVASNGAAHRIIRHSVFFRGLFWVPFDGWWYGRCHKSGMKTYHTMSSLTRTVVRLWYSDLKRKGMHAQNENDRMEPSTSLGNLWYIIRWHPIRSQPQSNHIHSLQINQWSTQNLKRRKCSSYQSMNAWALETTMYRTKSLPPAGLSAETCFNCILPPDSSDQYILYST